MCTTRRHLVRTSNRHHHAHHNRTRRPQPWRGDTRPGRDFRICIGRRRSRHKGSRPRGPLDPSGPARWSARRPPPCWCHCSRRPPRQRPRLCTASSDRSVLPCRFSLPTTEVGFLCDPVGKTRGRSTPLRSTASRRGVTCQASPLPVRSRTRQVEPGNRQIPAALAERPSAHVEEEIAVDAGHLSNDARPVACSPGAATHSVVARCRKAARRAAAAPRGLSNSPVVTRYDMPER